VAEVPLSNPERLLLALDALLDHRVNLVLYGRSAVWLGFDNPPPEVGATKDVDAIIRMSQLDELVNDEQFWDSRDAVNVQFKGEDMYITHLPGESGFSPSQLAGSSGAPGATRDPAPRTVSSGDRRSHFDQNDAWKR
jgi:hypothetical protein